MTFARSRSTVNASFYEPPTVAAAPPATPPVPPAPMVTVSVPDRSEAAKHRSARAQPPPQVALPCKGSVPRVAKPGILNGHTDRSLLLLN